MMKPKKGPSTTGVFSPGSGNALPLWDEAQMQQEFWGGSLGLPAREPGVAVELRNTEGKIVVPSDKAQHEAFKDCITCFSTCARECATSEVMVDWKRPVEILSPFRPMVHRNTTPFLHPYDTERKLFDGEAEEEALKQAVQPASKKAATLPVPLHIQFPEIVNVMDPEALERGRMEFEGVTDDTVIKKYRELQPLMGAYNPKLDDDLAATPAEAYASQYSTLRRYRLKEVDSISKLSEPPPFVMDAFNSALSLIEYAQTLVKSGDYLWELVYPKAPGTHHPVYNPYGKYAVRLFINGAFRRVMIDDYMPVDALGRSFLTFTSKGEIWPALLAKAIFVALDTSAHLLFTDPESIVSCLLGEWIPQRIDPSLHSTEVCALLLAQQRDLQKKDVLTLHLSSSSEEASFSEVLLPSSPSHSHNETSEKEPKVERGAGDFNKCDDTEIPSEGDVPVVPRKTVVCAIASITCSQRRLFVIHDVAFFRNTLALRMSTTSPSTIIDVNELMSLGLDKFASQSLGMPSCCSAGPTPHDILYLQSSSTSSFWVILDDFSARFHLLVWRQFGDESPFQFSSQISSDSIQPSVTTARKKPSAPSNSTGRNTVRWVHITSDKPEQIVLISQSCFPLTSQTTAPGLKAAKYPHLSSSSPVNRSLSAHPLSSSPDSMEAPQEVQLDLYTWDCGDMFSHMEPFLYEPGKLQCMLYTLPAGSHILRVTAVGLDAPHTISLLATHNFVMGDEREALRSANVFKMSDAGIHMGVERPNAEVMWFKRRITLKEPTTISFLVSSLEADEDPAAHRDIPPFLLKDPKSTKARVAGTKAPKEPPEEIPQRACEFPIIPYCRILLMDLDTGAISTGAVGRLVRQRLEPNQQGFLVMAFVMIDSALVPSLVDNATTVVSERAAPQPETSSSSSAPEEKDAFLVDKHLPLCSKGFWKLTISADRMLDSYKQLPLNVFSFSDMGQLKRGSNSMLFAYVCTVTEKTDLTLLLDLNACDPISFHVKVLRTGVDAPPVFVSKECTTHLFLSHVTLELGDKAKNASYTIEAWLDETMVHDWEGRRRHAQEIKFHSLRSQAEVKANEKRVRDLEEYWADPHAFVERLGQQTVTQVDNATISSKEFPANNAKKGRTGGEKRKTVANSTLPERSRVGLPGATAPSNATSLLLDSTDDALVVTFDLRMHFSAKADVRNGAVVKDSLASLRAMWMPPIVHTTHDQATLPASQHSSRAGATKWKQKEIVVSPEEQLKADQGRMSRQRFLENPRNILFPYLLTSDEGGVAVGRGELARANALKDIPSPIPMASHIPVVTEVAEEANYLHAPILSGSAYCVPLYPLRAMEWSPPLSILSLQSSHGVQHQQQHLQLQRIKSPNDRSSSRIGATSPMIPQSILLADDSADVVEIKSSLHEVLQNLGMNLRMECDMRSEGRKTLRGIMHDYWDARQPDVPLLSLLKPREEEAGKRVKTRSRMAN